MKKVSIIIPCYNKAKYVAEAINSALSQTYKDIEVVCVNDGSTDNSAAIIKEIAKTHSNITFIDFKGNKGVIKARNTAIEKAKGDYILPLDADDIIADTYVEKAVKILNKNPKVGIVYCKAKIFGDKEKIWKLPAYNFPDILYKNCIFCTALFRKADFIKVGGYKADMAGGCEDWDLWLSFIENGFEVRQIDEFLFKYRRSAEPSRNDIAGKNDDWKNILFKRHADLYLQDPNLGTKILFDTKLAATKAKKLNKYKTLFNLFLSISVILLVTLLTLSLKGCQL